MSNIDPFSGTRGNAADSDRFNFYSGPGETLGLDYREVDGAVIHLISQEIELPLKEWSHFAVVRESETYKVYRNGMVVAHKTDSNPKTARGYKLDDVGQTEF